MRYWRRERNWGRTFSGRNGGFLRFRSDAALLRYIPRLVDHANRRHLRHVQTCAMLHGRPPSRCCLTDHAIRVSLKDSRLTVTAAAAAPNNPIAPSLAKWRISEISRRADSSLGLDRGSPPVASEPDHRGCVTPINGHHVRELGRESLEPRPVDDVACPEADDVVRPVVGDGYAGRPPLALTRSRRGPWGRATRGRRRQCQTRRRSRARVAG